MLSTEHTIHLIYSYFYSFLFFPEVWRRTNGTESGDKMDITPEVGIESFKVRG